jgi:hypothetical protein
MSLRQAFLMTDIQALVLGIRKECSWRKLAAGDTTVGSTPSWRQTRAFYRSARFKLVHKFDDRVVNLIKPKENDDVEISLKKASITENPHPEDVPKIDWDGIARTWMGASEQQRSDWLAAMPAEAQLFAPKPGQKPRTAFLGKLREIINTEVSAAA